MDGLIGGQGQITRPLSETSQAGTMPSPGANIRTELPPEVKAALMERLQKQMLMQEISNTPAYIQQLKQRYPEPIDLKTNIEPMDLKMYIERMKRNKEQ